jgi:hypothetical protein
MSELNRRPRFFKEQRRWIRHHMRRDVTADVIVEGALLL